MHPFRRLLVWTKAHELTLRAYRATDGGTSRRYPALTAQLRRAMASIPASIAEGAGHSTAPQFTRCIEIAQASGREADYHLLLAKELGAITTRDYATLEARLSEVQAMLMGLRKRVLERVRQERGRGGRAAEAVPASTSRPPRTGRAGAGGPASRVPP